MIIKYYYIEKYIILQAAGCRLQIADCRLQIAGGTFLYYRHPYRQGYKLVIINK
jgi:hypothetical protein